MVIYDMPTIEWFMTIGYCEQSIVQTFKKKVHQGRFAETNTFKSVLLRAFQLW